MELLPQFLILRPEYFLQNQITVIKNHRRVRFRYDFSVTKKNYTRCFFLTEIVVRPPPPPLFSQPLKTIYDISGDYNSQTILCSHCYFKSHNDNINALQNCIIMSRQQNY